MNGFNSELVGLQKGRTMRATEPSRKSVRNRVVKSWHIAEFKPDGRQPIFRLNAESKRRLGNVSGLVSLSFGFLLSCCSFSFPSFLPLCFSFLNLGSWGLKSKFPGFTVSGSNVAPVTKLAMAVAYGTAG
jgi:hypothetical protein